MAFVPFSALQATSRPDAFPSFIAHDGRVVCDWAVFWARVGRIRQFVLERNHRRWVIASDDVVAFSAALLAVLQAGKEVLLPRNLTDSARTEISDADTGVLSSHQVAGFPLISDIYADQAPGSNDDFPAIDPQTAILRLYTSGSTGEPKEVVKKLCQIEAELQNLHNLWGANYRGCTVHTTVQHHHFYGLLFYVLMPICAGLPLSVDIINYPEGLLALRHDATVIVGSPAFFKRFVEASLAQLHFTVPPVIFSSGGNLSLEIGRQVAERTKGPVLEIYGSTETGGIAWRNNPEQALWTAFPGIELAIGTESCIALRSPYLADRDWLLTSDQGQLDAAGRLSLSGRLDSVVKIEEKRVSLTEIERRLLESPYIAEARVIALEEGRQFLAAVVVLTAAGQEWMQGQAKLQLNTYFRNYLRAWFEATVLPRKWRFVPVLPHDSMGKVARSSLAALFESSVQAGTDRAGGIVVDQVVREGDQVLVDFHVPADALWFQGHFPSFPLLPGVVQIDWLMSCATRYLELQADLRAIPRLKFMKPILPDLPMRLELKLSRDPLQLAYRYLHALDASVYSSGKLNLEART